MLMSRLNKFRQLARAERWLLVQSLLLLPIIHLALILLGYARLRRALETLSPLNSSMKAIAETANVQRAQEIARIVSLAAQHGLYRATCLRRSLLLWWFLRRDGMAGKLRFGIRVFNHRLEAHAWVEYQGTVVDDAAGLHKDFQALHEVLPSTALGL
jgi:hypothetical protein